MRLSLLAAAGLGELLLNSRLLVAAADPLWIPPSASWYGIDGNWSTFSFLVGSPPQSVNLLPSTTLAEIWVVESGNGCKNVVCDNARGGVFNSSASRTWQTMGTYELGLSWLGQYGLGNGDYGLETVSVTNRNDGGTTIAVDNALVAGITLQYYYQGFIGLGVTGGNFNGTVPAPYINELATKYGTIPSYSYGFTAGAHYAGLNGVPASLTLGGYDTQRFQSDAAVTFNMNPAIQLPTVTLRSISVSTTDQHAAVPSGWGSNTRVLANMSDLSEAVLLDSSTPMLWLPTAICEQFESALNLTWNETLGVYQYPNTQQYTQFLRDSPFKFTFTLSSYDDKDVSKGLDGHGIVNVTVSAAAFAQYLLYPFESIISLDQYAVPYFPLRRIADNATAIIGRAFMQEAYMVVAYDSSQLSVSQAVFPSNPYTNYSLVAIDRPSDSQYQAYQGSSSSGGFSPAVYAGIAVAAAAACIGLGVTLWCWRRSRKSKSKPSDPEEEVKDFESVTETEEPQSPVKRIFSKITRRKKSKKPIKVHEVAGNDAQPVEVGAEANNQRYEMPVPPEPVELDCNDIMDDVTELGTEDMAGLSAYEIARRKLDRQLLGPVPTYTPPATGTTISTDEKTEQDVSPVAHYRPPPEDHSPVSPESGNNSNSLPNTLPSPLSPNPTGWPLQSLNMPLPNSVAPPMPSPATASNPSTTYSGQSPRSFEPSSLSRSNTLNSATQSPRSPVGSLPPHAAANVQRSPIDPSRVICLGPLPEHLRLPHPQPSIPRLITSNGQPVVVPSPSSESSDDHQRTRMSDTLGSNFTVDEEQDRGHGGAARQQGGGGSNPASPVSPASAHSNERIDPGSELIHVPQMADRRYSWEEGGEN